jgi:Ca2+-binding RTX toxin-like protein
METIIELLSGPYVGPAGNTTYIVDPDTLGDASVSDNSGIDTLIVYDRPGRTAGEFEQIGGNLIWSAFDGGSVEMNLPDGPFGIEFFQWERLAEDGTPYTNKMRILYGTETVITGSKFVFAGTGGVFDPGDVIISPLFSNRQGGFSEIYGNFGDDRLVGSNKHLVILYGGSGNDTLIGKGRQADDMYGDYGNDVLRGNKGDDGLDGGASNDRIFGGAGDDEIRGGTGADLLKGQGGEDQFIFNADDGNEGRDTIFGFTIGTDKVLLEEYAAGANIISILQGNGGALVTLLETNTKIFFDGLSAAQIQANGALIFEIA